MKLVILLVAIIGLSACSKSGGGEDTLKAIDGTQEKTLRAFTQEVTDVTNSAPGSSQVSLFGQMSEMRVNHERAVSQKGQKYQQELSAAVNSSKCQTDTLPAEGNNEEFFEYGIEVGDSANGECALAYEMNMQVETKKFDASGIQTTTVKASSDARFEVRDFTSVYLIMDIFKFNYDFSLDSKVIYQTNADTLTMKTAGAGNATFVSKEHGTVPMAISVASSGLIDTLTGEGTIKDVQKIVIAFKDFRAVGEIRGTQEKEDKRMDYIYYLNGQVVTKSKFRRLFGDLIGESPSKGEGR